MKDINKKDEKKLDKYLLKLIKLNSHEIKFDGDDIGLTRLDKLLLLDQSMSKSQK